MALGGDNYLALARKYRPQVFEDVVGQEHVLKALAHSIDSGRTHHAYLLTGTRGIGKTTIARIFAKALECEQGVSSHPCGKCDACVNITNGSYPDVIEIDAASQTKVDDTRQLLENTQYPPINARYKIYIIDEVHMLTTSSFNALLKTLEEPPAYVKFILATTDPHKIPATVLSRCLQFQLRALNLDEIARQLQNICDKEQVKYEPEAIMSLARAARGSMRDALSLCDQAIALGHGELTAVSVQGMLGTVGDALITDILELLADGPAAASTDGAGNSTFATLLDKIRHKAPNYKSLLDELVIAFHDLALFQLVGATKLEVFSFSTQMLATYAARIAPQQVQLYYQIILEGVQEYQYAADGRSAFEMTLLRLLAFTPEKKKVTLWRGEGNGVRVSRLDELVQQVRGGSGRALLPSRQVAAPAAIKGNFDLQAALRADGLVVGLVPSAASSAAATAATATAAAAGAVLAPQSLLRGLSEGDTHQLLTAIKQGPEAVTACVEQLGSALGFDSAQRGTIVQLAQTLARGQGALLSAQSALSQAQQQQARTERALQQLQQQRGLPPHPVKSAIADPKGSALEQPQPEWAQFPQQTITPEGEGPQGGIGPGFTAPSLQERVAAAAHAAQQAAQQNAASGAAAPAAVPASASSAPQVEGATADFLKKVDTDSKFDYSDQQKDLAAIRAGAGGFTTKVLDLNQLEKSEPFHDAAEAAASQLIMETLPQVRSYFQLLETESKQLEQEFGGGNSKKGVNYDSELTSVVAGIRKARSDIDAGIKPSVPPSVNDSSSLTLATASEQGTSDFSLTQQTSSGFDVNDPRNLGAQLVGSVSLAANESAAAPGGSFELPTSAPTAQPTLPAASQSTLPAASQPTFLAAAQSTAPAAPSPLPVPPSVGVAEATPSAASDELSSKLLARAAALADDASAPVSVVATPQPLSTEVNRSLQAMVSSLQAAEGHSADDLSIDDIMGSDLGSESLSALTPVNVAAVPASAPSAAPLSAGVQSTPADLPPWPVKSNLQTIAPESAAVGAASSSSSLSLEPTTAGAPLAPQTAPSAPVPIDAQVLLPSSPMVNESSGQVSVVGQAHDAALLNPEAAAQQAMRTAAQNLEQLDHARSSAQPLSDDERHAQQQKLASAAMDALSSLGQQLEQDLESSGNTGPSPWDELSSVTVLSVDERSIEIKFPKQEKLARISDHNMLVQESAEAVASSAHVFTTTLKLCLGEKWPEQGVNAIVERLERELHSQQEQQAAEQAAHEAWLQKFKEQVAAGTIREGASADFQAVLATRHAALAATNAPVTTAPSLAPNAGSEPIPAALHPAQPAALAASAEPQFPTQPEVVAVPAAPQFPAQLQPQVAPTAGPDFGALPDYIAEAQEYLGDAASYAAMGGDNGGGDDDDDINDVDFGQAGAQQGLAQAPEAGADLAEMALVQRAQDAPAAAASALPVRLETSEVPGRRRLNQDDFLDLVALEDPWFQLLLQVFPDRGPVFATLTGVQRLIDPSNPNHWRLGIDRKVDLSFVDPDFWNNMQQRFEQHLHTKLQIEVELLDMMPHGAPVQLALIKEHEAQVHAKADVQKIKPLNNLLKIMGENWDRVGIKLYHSGKLPLSPHH